jgi:predicted transposase YbfD/YdcC
MVRSPCLARSATAFVAMIRQHWHIENKLHWSLDVTFNKIAAASGRTMLPKIWLRCGTLLSICCGKSIHTE